MIFLDVTGKRWRAVKRSATTGIAGVVLPVALVGGGAYLFNPGWINLAIKPIQKLAAANSQATTPAVTTAKGASKTSRTLGATVASSSSSPNTVAASSTTDAGQPPATTDTTVPQTSPVVTSPTPTSTTANPTAKSKNVDPGKSDGGLAHHFTPL